MREFLTIEQLKKLEKNLTPEQRKVLAEYKKFRFNSSILTEINQNGSQWLLFKEKIYPFYDRKHPNNSPLVCCCGKHVKILYLCKSADGKEIKGFGSKHIKDEAMVPSIVIKQVNKLHHKIDRGTDQILTKVADGEKFPLMNYQFAEKHHLLNCINPVRLKYVQAFKKVDLPIYDEYEYTLKFAINEYLEQRSINFEESKYIQVIKPIFALHLPDGWYKRQTEIEHERAVQKAKEERERLKTERFERKRRQAEFAIDNNGTFITHLRDIYLKIFKYQFEEAKAEGLGLSKYDEENLPEPLAIYCIFNSGNFKHGEVIRNYKQAITEAKSILQEREDLSELIECQEKENTDKYMERLIRQVFVTLYARLKIIGKNEDGHPTAMFHEHFIW